MWTCCCFRFTYSTDQNIYSYFFHESVWNLWWTRSWWLKKKQQKHIDNLFQMSHRGGDAISCSLLHTLVASLLLLCFYWAWSTSDLIGWGPKTEDWKKKENLMLMCSNCAGSTTLPQRLSCSPSSIKPASSWLAALYQGLWPILRIKTLQVYKYT